MLYFNDRSLQEFKEINMYNRERLHKTYRGIITIIRKNIQSLHYPGRYREI